jgi:hypothetical protein
MNNFAKYFAIESNLKKIGFDGDRSVLIDSFTSGRKDGLKQLTDWEYKEFIEWLSTQYPAQTSTELLACDIMRKKIISLLRKIGYAKDGRADMPAIYAWVLKYGYLKKPLMDYTHSELPKLVTQAETFYKSSLL